MTWTATAGATYEVLRLAAGAASSTLGTSTSGALTDNTATADTAYLYKVRAIAPSVSPYSAPDLATTVIFTDDRLDAQTAVIKAVHVSELRTAVQAVRGLAGLKPASFTDATIDTTVMIQAAHISELRSALDTARSALELPALRYTDLTLDAGATIIKAAHFQELRLGVK